MSQWGPGGGPPGGGPGAGPSAAGGPPPGWYADPAGPGSLRWWDGWSWTAYTAPLSPPLASPLVPAPARDLPHPAASLAGERRAAGWARRAVVVIAGVQAIATPWTVYLGAFEDRNFLRLSDGATSPPMLPADFYWGYLPVAVGTVAIVLLAVWMYRAAVHARRLGLPARRSAVWAWLAWMIPVVNFWFPYQVIRDCLPPSDGDGRRRVLRWWLLYQLGGSCLGLAAFLVGLTAGFGPATWLTVVAAGLLWSVVPASVGLSMVRAVDGSLGQMTDRLVTGGSAIGDPW